MTKEEAIKFVRENMHLSYDEGNIFEAIKTLVPELSESEDERIRKEIIGYLTHRADVTAFVDETKDCERWIAYLEKQKEQKSVECIEFDNEFKNQVSHLLASVLNREWEYSKEFVEYTAQQLLGYAKHEISPEEWSEEDKVKLNDVIRLIEDSGHVQSIREHYTTFLKTLPNRFSLNPSWKPSEEQMVVLLNAEGLVRANNFLKNAKILASLYEQLKKL